MASELETMNTVNTNNIRPKKRKISYQKKGSIRNNFSPTTPFFRVEDL